jgi:hypothetical protein
MARGIGRSLIVAPVALAALAALFALPLQATAQGPYLGPLAKPLCQAGDRTETGLDGQLTLAERARGASTRPFNCNLAIVGEYAGQGAGHQLLWYGNCAYLTTDGYDAGQRVTARNMPFLSPQQRKRLAGLYDPPLQHPGIQVLDVSNPRAPRLTAHLDDPAALYPWETAAVNSQRALLGIAESWHGDGPQPAVAFYDLSHCAHPQRLFSGQLPDPNLVAHAGNFAYDGMTYWLTSWSKHRLYAIDVADPRHPKLILDWDFPHRQPGGAGAHQICHRISLNQFTVDGHPPDTLLFCGLVGQKIRPGVYRSGNGLVIYDVSQVQDRRAHPAIKVISTLYWVNGSTAIQPDLAFIDGKPFLAVGDECGSGGCHRYPRDAIAACRAGQPPYGFERLIDISNLEKPKLVAQLMLGVDDPKNCALTEHDITVTMGGLGYSLHDCTFDNPLDAKLLACSSHQAGIRVFDIHDPYEPREIAYFVGPAPPLPTQIDPGSLLNPFQGVSPPVNFSWSKAHSRFVWRDRKLYLWVSSSHNAFYVLRFENQGQIRSLKPVPTPGNEDYQD